jgi:hypothetical protein
MIPAIRKTVAYSLLLLASGCLDPFEPDIHSEDLNILVIDGFMNTSSNEVNVHLSRTRPIQSDSVPSPPELNSIVTIEDNSGIISELRDDGSGNYNLNNYPFDYTKLYRLNVTREDGSSYQSDFVPPMKTPPIDSITWRAEADKIVIYANTHDFETIGPQYYLWDWKETWEHWTYFHSNYYVRDGRAVLRRPDEQVDVCWSTRVSPSILTFSTRNLSTNVVRDFKLHEIDGRSSKLYWRYSINVRQRVVTKEAYQYWQLLKTANESTGSLFAPMPPEVQGNFTPIGSDKIVLGYFSAGTTSQQRIFIRHNDLPDHIRALKVPDADCRIIPGTDTGTPAILTHFDLSFTANGTPLIDVAPGGYYVAARVCLDCRARGGINVTPSFWPL